MSNTTWKVLPVASVPEDGETLRFERRGDERWPVSGVATAFCVSGDDFGRMTDLRMLDYSPLGLGAMCDQPLTPGMIVSLGFQSPSYLARRGSVVRCTPCGQGYRVAIRFDLRLAA